MANGDDRVYEAREYLLPSGEKVEYRVYYSKRIGKDKPAIEKDQAFMLANVAGLHSISITHLHIVEDYQFYSKTQRPKFGKILPIAKRYIYEVCCYDAAGNFYSAMGSAAPDSVDMLKNYLPEMAYKRAAVRVVLMALGLHDLNADIEFSDSGDDGNNSTEEVEIELLSQLQKLVKQLKWEKADLAKHLKAVDIKEQPTEMTAEELNTVITSMKIAVVEKTKEVKEAEDD